MSTVPLTIADESGTTLIGGQRLAGQGIDGQGVAPLVDGRATGQELDGLGGPAVISQRAETGVGDTDLIMICPVGQAAGTARADQVVCAGRGDVIGDVAGCGTAPGAGGIQRDDRVIKCGRAKGDIQSAACSAAGDVVVGDGRVDDRRIVAALDASGVSVRRVICDGGVDDG